MLGNDGITLYAAGQASLEQLISSNLSATPGSPPARPGILDAENGGLRRDARCLSLCGCSSSFCTPRSFSEGQAIPWMPENSLSRGPALPMTPGTLPSVVGGKELPRDPEGALC